MGRLWDLAEEAGITVFGTGAAYIHGCMKAGVKPAEGRSLAVQGGRLDRLAAVAGGLRLGLRRARRRVAVLDVGRHRRLHRVRRRHPVEAGVGGGAAGAALWAATSQAFDEAGNSIVEEVGELVIAQPMPSMPLCFWGDEDGSRLRESYFDMYPGVWRHGDWIRITDRGHARSSTAARTRRSTAAASAWAPPRSTPPPSPSTRSRTRWSSTSTTGCRCSSSSTASYRRRRTRSAPRIREHCSPRHVPSEIIRVDAVPRTLSGKVLEVPVKKPLPGRRTRHGRRPRVAREPRGVRLVRRVRARAR